MPSTERATYLEQQKFETIKSVQAALAKALTNRTDDLECHPVPSLGLALQKRERSKSSKTVQANISLDGQQITATLQAPDAVTGVASNNPYQIKVELAADGGLYFLKDNEQLTADGVARFLISLVSN